MGFLNTDQMLDEFDDSSWRNDSPLPHRELPRRICYTEDDGRHRKNHEPHEWWMPVLARTQVFGPRVVRTLEVAWYWCEGRMECD